MITHRTFNNIINTPSTTNLNRIIHQAPFTTSSPTITYMHLNTHNEYLGIITLGDEPPLQQPPPQPPPSITTLLGGTPHVHLRTTDVIMDTDIHYKTSTTYYVHEETNRVTKDMKRHSNTPPNPQNERGVIDQI